ncbi:MAG: hypothetical protein ACJ77E_04890 [Gaiellaceae bacterium]
MGTAALIVLVAGLAFAAGASAVSPDVAKMNLQAADVAGAKVANEHAVTIPGYTAAHFRSFLFSAPNKGAHLIGLESVVSIAAGPQTAAKDVSDTEKFFRSSVSRKLFVARTARVANVKPKAISLGRPHAIAGYDQGFEVATSIGLKGGRIYENVVFVRLDRVFVQMIEQGTRPITIPVTTRYAGAIARHIATELSPADVSVPTVTGTAQQGQTLTATAGAWTAPDATFTYQWQDCDTAGANCVDVAGATSRTYAVSATDVGKTVHVVVAATNRFGTADAPSAASAVVT